MGETEEERRIIARYSLATLLAALGIFILESFFSNSFDSVAAVGLFSCIIAVTGEDTSLGPVIYKSVCRSSGALLGGMCGYLLLFIPMLLFPSNKKIALIIVPTLFVAFVQWITKGGSETLTKFVKDKKISHLIIQLQVAFGSVFIGSWSAPENALLTSVCRTSGILYGCIALLIAAVVAYPQTSLHASCENLAQCLQAAGTLLSTICRDRIEARALNPYDHTSKQFSEDEHAKLIQKIETKLARVLFLQSFLHIEPGWVFGYPIILATKDTILSHEWITFVGVMASRMGRIRSSLAALDSNARIDSDRQGKFFKTEIANDLQSLSGKVMTTAFSNVSRYIQSPYAGRGGWRGEIGLKAVLVSSLSELKTDIERLVDTVNRQVTEFNSVRDKNRDTMDVTAEVSVPAEVLPLRRRGGGESSPGRRYKPEKSKTRTRLGSTLDSWHKIYPMRTFCTLSVQIAVQTSSLLSECIKFIEVVPDLDSINPQEGISEYQHMREDEISPETLFMCEEGSYAVLNPIQCFEISAASDSENGVVEETSWQ